MPPGLSEALRQGAYLTDGAKLFRVAGIVSGSSGPKVIELEDCRTLEVGTYSEADLVALGLSPVRSMETGDELG